MDFLFESRAQAIVGWAKKASIEKIMLSVPLHMRARNYGITTVSVVI
jgi:hypothetical protein